MFRSSFRTRAVLLVLGLSHIRHMAGGGGGGGIRNERPPNSISPGASYGLGTRCSSVVRAFAHGAMGHRIDPSSGGPIELFLVPGSAPRLV